ncbi:hypothetical protein RHMOL_Rhmol05G0088700 [Rhododendron molle]|nr:hypothetical protein RHMOL_Rhmol05G0088700 [Rhododendron molle]KAI8554310.1 hypothetical protein RHMOL_Rhmol05G0088700 [Rhododendron molle]
MDIQFSLIQHPLVGGPLEVGANASYGLAVKEDIRGNSVPLKSYKGKVVLVVNVASK